MIENLRICYNRPYKSVLPINNQGFMRLGGFTSFHYFR